MTTSQATVAAEPSAHESGKDAFHRVPNPPENGDAVEHVLTKSRIGGMGRRAKPRITLSCAFLAALGLLTFPADAQAAESAIAGQASGQILAAGDRRVMVLSPVGDVLWEYPTKLTHDVWMLPSGNVLFADGDTVTEVTREKQVVFQYRAAEQTGGGTYACQRLPDGKTFVGENSTGRLLELDPDGKVIFALQTSPFQAGQHHNMRMARRLGNGNYLVCHSGARLVKEYTPKGEAVWEVKVPGSLAFAAIRTASGSTLVSCLDRVVEYDPGGKSIWECRTEELGAAATARNLTGINLLPNGDVVTGCYQAYADGQGCGLVEISREKKAVWSYSKPKGDQSMMAVELLSTEGKPLPGDVLR
jgi:outer membrane protein assembly factor BamB